MYLYSPQSIPTVMCQLSILRTDRTCWSTWPDASGRWQRSNWKLNTLSDRTRRRVRLGVIGHVRSRKNLSVLWPDALTSPIGDDRTRSVSEVPLWKWTGRTIDASDRFPSCVRSQHLPSLTLVNTISASDHSTYQIVACPFATNHMKSLDLLGCQFSIHVPCRKL
jgi:hypothetical protein